MRALQSVGDRIELVAASDPKPGSEQWAGDNLPPSTKFFSDPEQCLREGGAEAVLISTATATHAPLVMMALDLGLVSLIGLSEPDAYNSMSCVRSPSP